MSSPEKPSNHQLSKTHASQSRQEKAKSLGSDSLPEYQWPPQRDANLEYGKKPRNAVHSVVTALPIIMVLVALIVYYRAESRQSHNLPIRSESVEINATFTGLSVVSGGEGRHYLWVDFQGKPKGVRVHAKQAQRLQSLIRDESIFLKIAPTIAGSDTYWAWYVEQAGEVLLDTESQLQ